MNIVHDSMADKFCYHPNQTTAIKGRGRYSFYWTTCPDCPQAMASVRFWHVAQMSPWLKEEPAHTVAGS